MNCIVCNGEMVRGDAIMNTAVASRDELCVWDTDDGITINLDGKAIMVRVYKCSGCGHSFVRSASH